MLEREFLTMIVYRVPSLQRLLVEPRFSDDSIRHQAAGVEELQGAEEAGVAA